MKAKIKLHPRDLHRKVMAVNLVLTRIQQGTTHPSFYHQHGLHGQVLLDNADHLWWNDPVRGFRPIQQARETPIGMAAFRGLVYLLILNLQQDIVIAQTSWPTPEELGLDPLEGEGSLGHAPAVGLVKA